MEPEYLDSACWAARGSLEGTQPPGPGTLSGTERSTGPLPWWPGGQRVELFFKGAPEGSGEVGAGMWWKGQGPVFSLGVCHTLTRAGLAMQGHPPCSPTSLCMSFLRVLGSGSGLPRANSRGQGLNQSSFHQVPSGSPPRPLPADEPFPSPLLSVSFSPPSPTQPSFPTL